MKKVVLFFSVCAAMALASCSCGNKCENAAVADSTVADSTVADSTVADSTVADSSKVAE